jgi:hypothetical protein
MDWNHDKVIQSHAARTRTDPWVLNPLVDWARSFLFVGCWSVDDEREQRHFRAIRARNDRRSASDDQQVTKRSAESVLPRAKGFEGSGGQPSFFNCESARSAAHSGNAVRRRHLKTFTAANHSGST